MFRVGGRWGLARHAAGRRSSAWRAGGGTTRDAREPTGGRASTGTRDRVPPRAPEPSRQRQNGRSRRVFRVQGRRRCARQPRRRLPTGCQRRRVPPRERCCGPSGGCGRWGGWAVGTGRRTPFPRCAATPTRLRETSRSGSGRGRRSGETSRTTIRTGPARDRRAPASRGRTVSRGCGRRPPRPRRRARGRALRARDRAGPGALGERSEATFSHPRP